MKSAPRRGTEVVRPQCRHESLSSVKTPAYVARAGGRQVAALSTEVVCVSATTEVE